jgi:hypothetical protein
MPSQSCAEFFIRVTLSHKSTSHIMTHWLKRQLFSVTTTNFVGKLPTSIGCNFGTHKKLLGQKSEDSAHLSRRSIHHLYPYSTLLYFGFHQDEQHYPFDDYVHNCSLYAGGTAEAHDPPVIAGTFVTDDASGGEITSNFGKLSFAKVCCRIRVSFFYLLMDLRSLPSLGF